MSDEQVIYLSPLNNWRIVLCNKMWGFSGYEVERWDNEIKLWQIIYDGEHSLGRCFLYLKKRNIISKDEMGEELKKWTK